MHGKCIRSSDSILADEVMSNCVVETNIDTKLFERKLSNCIHKSSSADGEVWGRGRRGL